MPASPASDLNAGSRKLSLIAEGTRRVLSHGLAEATGSGGTLDLLLSTVTQTRRSNDACSRSFVTTGAHACPIRRSITSGTSEEEAMSVHAACACAQCRGALSADVQALGRAMCTTAADVLESVLGEPTMWPELAPLHDVRAMLRHEVCTAAQGLELSRLWEKSLRAPSPAGPPAVVGTSVYPATPGYDNVIKPANVRRKHA